ncbi:MAG: pilus assembly protein PilP [Nitrospirae bacterium]|nr:pilus assembly protein PilP [Nitrospirota bacterium]
MNKYLIGVIIVMLIALELAFVHGVSGGQDVGAQDKAKSAPEKPMDKPMEKPMDKPIVIVPYEYKSAGRRDPFLSILEQNKRRRQKEKGTTKEVRVLSPLETSNLASIKLIGIVIDQRDRYASVVLPDGRSFAIKKGTLIGVNGGKVVEIKPDRIIIEEVMVDDVGKKIVTPISICLNPEEAVGCSL